MVFLNLLNIATAVSVAECKNVIIPNSPFLALQKFLYLLLLLWIQYFWTMNQYKTSYWIYPFCFVLYKNYVFWFLKIFIFPLKDF